MRVSVAVVVVIAVAVAMAVLSMSTPRMDVRLSQKWKREKFNEHQGPPGVVQGIGGSKTVCVLSSEYNGTHDKVCCGATKSPLCDNFGSVSRPWLGSCPELGIVKYLSTEYWTYSTLPFEYLQSLYSAVQIHALYIYG